MAAGLGFKNFATGEVLTAADTNGYLMQGVWVFANATARDAAVTSPQEGNFAYLKDTNVTTYYTGSAWANLDTTGMTNPMTTTGDTIYSSSGSTPARLGIGSTGQVLTVAGGVPSWSTPSGGMTLISTTTLSGATTTLSSIPQTYNSLFVVVYGVTANTGNNELSIQPNAVSNLTDYIRSLDSSVQSNKNQEIGLFGGNYSLRTDSNNAISLRIDNYTSTTNYKPLIWSGFFVETTPTNKPVIAGGAFRSNTAITSLVLRYGGNTFSAGTVLLYGVK